jgi:uncharacterized protein (TIGR02996 family)
MTQADAFLQAIVEQPEDIAIRLIFADWLDENGESPRGEFIRVQIELATLPDARRHEPLSVREMVLLNRERELLSEPRHFVNWVPLIFHSGSGAGIRVAKPPRVELTGIGFQWVTFRRGFVESVTCTAADWIQHAAEIRRAAPIREVTLTDVPTVYYGADQNSYEIAGSLDMPCITQGTLVGYWRRQAASFLLPLRFPGIAFTLPPA